MPKGKQSTPNTTPPHRIDVDEVMETLKEVLRKIGKFSFTNKSEFEALVKNSLPKNRPKK